MGTEIVQVEGLAFEVESISLSSVIGEKTGQLKHLLVERGVFTTNGTLLNVVLCGARSSG